MTSERIASSTNIVVFKEAVHKTDYMLFASQFKKDLQKTLKALVDKIAPVDGNLKSWKKPICFADSSMTSLV